MGTNIGRVVLKVFFRDKSPFAAQPRQEEMHFFDTDSLKGYKAVNIDAIPAPINGFRISESLVNYDNFICDTKINCLEEAFFEQETSFSSTDEEIAELEAEQSIIPSDSSAAVRARLRKTENLPEDCKDFFTWQVSENIFKLTEGRGEDESIRLARESGVDPTEEQIREGKTGSGGNPPPRLFTDGPKIDNAAEWTYMAFPRPNGNNKALFLTPFMKKSPPDRANAVHWGTKMTTALALNQPFEIMYYFTKRDPIIPDLAQELTPRFVFRDNAGKELTELNLTKSIYFLIEIGIGSQQDHYLILLKNGSKPMFFGTKKNKSGQSTDAILLSTFSEVNFDKIFDANHKFLNISVEPVAGNLVIRSNVFGDKPWLVLGGSSNPIFVGHGPLALYGGNVQAGFAMRPIQYLSSGSFTTPNTTFLILGGSGPKCTTALKGAGEVEQDKSNPEGTLDPFAEFGKPGGTGSLSKLHAADAEFVNGESVKSVVEVQSKRATQEGSIQRLIRHSINVVSDSNTDPLEQSGFGNTEQSRQTVNNSVELLSGNMTQGNGYVVSQGRSPYIWRLTCSVPPGVGRDPEDLHDISCDVMSVDLNWNATSYNEIIQSGTISVLNRRQNSKDNPESPRNYRSFIDRAIYVRIEAYWEIGVGHDPGGKNRQIFEGLTVGATVDTNAEREVVNFKVEDYMHALHGGKFVRSPAYDGMSSSLAVQDIVEQIGLRDDRILRNNTQIKEANLSRDIGIPLVNINEKPKWRFRDGSSYKEAILKLAKLDFKSVYFDNLGRFHYDDIPGGIWGDEALPEPVDFYSSIRKATSAGDAGADILARIVWNNISFTRNIGDVYNVISVKSVNKLTFNRISGGSAYSAGIFNPNATGYLGYRKHLVVEDAAIGSPGALFRYIDNYRRRIFIPPLTARFSTYGYSGLKPLDIIRLDGQYLRIMTIQKKISAQDNNYWMDIEGEWFFSVGKGEDPQLHMGANEDQGGPGSGETGSLSASAASTLR